MATGETAQKPRASRRWPSTARHVIGVSSPRANRLPCERVRSRPRGTPRGLVFTLIARYSPRYGRLIDRRCPLNSLVGATSWERHISP
jgi:hypothetical protein